MPKAGLQYKLIRVFVLQVLLISAAVILGVFIAAKVFEDVLIREAMQGEARHYWGLYDTDPAAPRPNTLNLLGYLAANGDYSEVPDALKGLKPGYQRAALRGSNPIVYVEDRADARLFLVFDEERVTDLAVYFGIVPLSIALIVIYVLSWFSYRQSRQAISPVVRLAQNVEKFDFRSQRLSELDLSEFRGSPDVEVDKLVQALDRFTERVQNLIERERDFTRDASHELRTPLAVMKSAVALLEKRQDLRPAESRSVVLIRKAIDEMEALIETLLLLAREESSPMSSEDILINDLIAEAIEQVKRAVKNENVCVTLHADCLLSVRAPQKVLNILFANLLRNAVSYTAAGTVAVHIDEKSVAIADTGPGMEPYELDNALRPFYRGKDTASGHGLGLSIVNRFCNRFGWTLDITSEPGAGTTVTVGFPDARPMGKRAG